MRRAISSRLLVFLTTQCFSVANKVPGRHCRVSYSVLQTARCDALEALVLVTPLRGALGMA